MKKGLVIIILVLFVCMSVVPSSGIISKNKMSIEIQKENDPQPDWDFVFELDGPDSYVSHQYPDENYGSSEYLQIANEYGVNGSPGWADVAYIEFPRLIDLVRPVNTNIVSAELFFYYDAYENTNPEGRVLNIYRVTDYWNEDTLTWNNQPAYESEPISKVTVPSSTGKWIIRDVTSDVRSYVNGEWPPDFHKGYRISDDSYWGESDIPTTMIRSRENGESLRPYLEVIVRESKLKQTKQQFITGSSSQNIINSVPSPKNIVFNNDTMPPVTIHTLDPPEPDGFNGWYVSDVTVTLNATDDMSGVKEIIYRIDGDQGIISGDNGTFTITDDDDGDDVLVEYWAVDNAGNVESRNSFTIDMDQTPPLIDLTYTYEWTCFRGLWLFIFEANATDFASGMERVEFYLNDVVQEIVYGPGPEFIWSLLYCPIPCAIFWATAYDMAGNNDFDTIKEPCSFNVEKTLRFHSEDKHVFLLY